jgi:hypothetical protein
MRIQAYGLPHSAQKTKFEDLQTKICVGVEGWLGNTQAYSLSYYFTNLDFFFWGLASVSVKKLHQKTLSY